MGYRSEVALKTTTEGYVLFDQYNKTFTKDEDQPLRGAKIEHTKDGFYKISFSWVKWYDGYHDVDNFMAFLDKLEEYGIPFSFVRIGEDSDDNDIRVNWTDDIPDEIGSFGMVRSFDDPNDGEYESEGGE